MMKSERIIVPSAMIASTIIIDLRSSAAVVYD
jgi:hypothetical protein